MIYKLKTDKLIIRHNKSATKSCVYIAPSEDYNNSGLGQLFIVIEAKSREKRIADILQQVVDELSEYYYHSPTKNAEAALETTAQYFNENISDISGKDLKWVKEKINIIIAAVQDNKLILSHYHQIKLWLFRDNKIHDVTGQQNEKKLATGKKILSQLISGQLKNQDTLLITNHTIFDYFSDEKIKKTVTTLAPTQACAFFKNTLIDSNITADFSTIVIKFLAYKKEPTRIEDVSKVNVLKKQTDKIDELTKLEPKLSYKYLNLALISFKKALFNIYDFIKEYHRVSTTKKEGLTTKNQSDSNKTTPPAKHQQKETPKAKLAANNGWLTKIKSAWQNNFAGKINLLKSRLMLFVILIAILFVGSLWLLHSKNKNVPKNTNFQPIASQIQDKLDSVEAALIYKDNQRARDLLSEGQNLFKQLQPQTEMEKKTYTELSYKIKKQVDKIYNLEEINQPRVLADLPNNFKASSNLLLGLNNIIYLSQANQIYKLNSKNKSLDKVAEVSGPIHKLTNLDKNTIIAKGDNNQIWLINTNNYQTKAILLPKNDEKSHLADIAIYANKLYALDNGESNIYKYIYKKNEFTQPSTWLKNKADLSQSKSILVDGNIWVVGKNGKINKFFKGKAELFEITGYFEKPGKQISLWTQDKNAYLYIIDQDKNRIIIAKKDGHVQRQLLGDKLQNILSLQTDTQEKKLYILTTKKIYLFEL